MRWLFGIAIVLAVAVWAWRWIVSESDRRQRELNRKWYELTRSARWEE